MPEKKQITFRGYSDDIVYIEGASTDEHSATGWDDGIVSASFVVGGKVLVRALYDGCWSFSVGQIEEAVQIPDEWDIEIRQGERPYSAQLVIRAPEHLTVVQTRDG